MKQHIYILDYFFKDDKLSHILKVRKASIVEFQSWDSEIRFEGDYKIVRDCQSWHDSNFENFAHHDKFVKNDFELFK